MTKSTADVAQGILALIGITLGVIPLGQVLLRGTPGSIWRWLPGGDGAPGAVVPALVALVAVVAIGVLEWSKRH